MVKVTIGHDSATTDEADGGHKPEQPGRVIWSAAGRRTADRPGVAMLGLCLLAALAPFNLNSPVGSGRLEVATRPLLLIQLAVSLTIIVAWSVRPAVRAGPMTTGQSGPPRPPGLLLVAAGAMVLFVGLSAAVSGDRLVGAGGAVTALALAATVIATVVTVGSADDVRLLLCWMVAGTVVAATIGLVVFVNGTDYRLTEIFTGRVTRLGLRPRLTRTWGHANVAAMAIAPTVAILGVGLLGRRRSRFRTGPPSEPGPDTNRDRWSTVGLTVMLLLVTVALVLTYSRAGFVAAAVGLTVGAVALVRSGLARGPVAAASTFLLLMVMVVAAAATPGWQNRFDPSAATLDFNAEVVPPTTVLLGPDGLTVPITVTNRSSRTWPAAGPDRIQLSARWLVPEGDRVVAEQRWPLPDDVGPGRSLTFDVTISQTTTSQTTTSQTTSSQTTTSRTAGDRTTDSRTTDDEAGADQPADGSATTGGPADGHYLLAWDLLLDREAYFLQFSGRQATSGATVFGRPAEANRPQETVPLVPPGINLTRTELWTIAFDGFVANPLLGAGPMQLPTFAEPQIDSNERLPGGHAHNLVLEALSTWGLLGTGPLLVIVLGGLWQLVRRIGDRRTTLIRQTNQRRPVDWTSSEAALFDAAALGALVALGLQAMAEWQLNEVGVAIPIALLLGIAWSGNNRTEPAPDPLDLGTAPRPE